MTFNDHPELMIHAKVQLNDLEIYAPGQPQILYHVGRAVGQRLPKTATPLHFARTVLEVSHSLFKGKTDAQGLKELVGFCAPALARVVSDPFAERVKKIYEQEGHAK